MTNAARIADFLQEHPGEWFDDDELSRALGIVPRQQVNQACRRLLAQGRIQRERRERKLANCAVPPAGVPPPVPAATRPRRPPEAAAEDDAAAPAATPLAAALAACVVEVRRLGLGELEPLLGEQLRHPDRRAVLLVGRTVCAALVARSGVSLERGLGAAIDERTRRSPGSDLLRTHLHTVRLLGNQAAHGKVRLSEEDALAGLHALLAALRAEVGGGP